MGLDPGHMSYDRLAQSLPPVYIELVFSQMCMQAAHDLYGAPVITFDDMRARPAAARRELARWLRGAGDAAPSAGLGLVQPERPREVGPGRWPPMKSRIVPAQLLRDSQKLPSRFWDRQIAAPTAVSSGLTNTKRKSSV